MGGRGRRHQRRRYPGYCHRGNYARSNDRRCRSFVLFGGSENLAALDLADGVADGRIGLSTFDTATDGTRGFVINRRSASACGG